MTLGLLIAHWLGDFFLQSNAMALGKSKSWGPLLRHTLTYSACFLPWGLEFALITFVLHTVTDYYTSRVGAQLWFVRRYCTQSNDDEDCGWEVPSYDARKRHWFFVWLGFDQLIHFVALAITYYWLVSRG